MTAIVVHEKKNVKNFASWKKNNSSEPGGGGFHRRKDDDNMAGYNGYSMSNNAVSAYNNGEKPISKWTKKVIINEINEIAVENDVDLTGIELSKLTVQELRDVFLNCSSWHHTGKLYNETVFYKIDEEEVKAISKETIDKIIASREKKDTVSEKKDTVSAKANKELLNEARDIYRKLEIIYISEILELKTLKGVCDRYLNGKLDVLDCYEKALQKIKQNDFGKVEAWKRLPEDHWRWEYVELYEKNMYEYTYRMYSNKNNNINNSIIQKIKEHLRNMK